jgi:acetolactate synthase-1/2/3 large subunit
MLNNQGHGMVRQTQEMWLGGNYYATSVEGGLGFPDFTAVARAHGIPADNLTYNSDIPAKLSQLLAGDGPAFLNVDIHPERRVVPQVKFGRPNEDADPLLERAEFLSNMVVQPLPVSLGK